MCNSETKMADEQVVLPCGECGIPILTWWEPRGGLLRGEYYLVGDAVVHPRCFDKWADRFSAALTSAQRDKT